MVTVLKTFRKSCLLRSLDAFSQKKSFEKFLLSSAPVTKTLNTTKTKTTKLVHWHAKENTFTYIVDRIFSSALCYCTAELLSWCGCPSSVCGHRFIRNRQVDWHQFLVTGTYPPYLQTFFIFVFQNFIFFFFTFFRFGLHGTIWEKKNQTTSSLKVKSDWHPKHHVNSSLGSLPKLFNELWNFKFWSFTLFFRFC